MPARVHEVRSSDGRRLVARLEGPDEGEVVFFHNGTPFDGPLFDAFIEAGAERGLRHLSYSRPGYGDSDRRPGRRVADCAEDVTAIADLLGIEAFLAVGWSGGGPHALACAALLGERVPAAATIAGVAPHAAEGFDWLDGMGAENLAEFAAAEAGEETLRIYLEGEAEPLRAVSAADVKASLGDLISEADRPALGGGFAEYEAAALRAALSHGVWGWLDDDLAFIEEWGFDLGSIDVPVAIWHGDDDRFVPVAHGLWLTEHVSGATSCLRAGEGHLSLLAGAYGEVLDQLVMRAS
jgi:pimeloyl-ACP methyl ester carboxylesterase